MSAAAGRCEGLHRGGGNSVGGVRREVGQPVKTTLHTISISLQNFCKSRTWRLVS